MHRLLLLAHRLDADWLVGLGSTVLPLLHIV